MIGRADRVLGRADHGNDAVARRSGIADYGRAGFMLFAIAAASAGAIAAHCANEYIDELEGRAYR